MPGAASGAWRPCIAACPAYWDVTAGYANGDTADHANYDDVCTGRTGFREAVQVAYEDGTVSLPHLLFVFFAAIDPETPNRQGPDVGSQYQTGVYWMDPADEGIIRSIAALEAAAVPFFAVELKALACFYPAEEFHQRYLEKHPRGYCHVAPLETGRPAGLPLFHKDLYPSRKRAAADLERSRRSVFLTGGGNSVFHRLTIFV